MSLVLVGIDGLGEELVLVAMAEPHVLKRYRRGHIGGIPDRPFAQHERLVGEFQRQLAGSLAGIFCQPDTRNAVTYRVCLLYTSDAADEG